MTLKDFIKYLQLINKKRISHYEVAVSFDGDYIDLEKTHYLVDSENKIIYFDLDFESE